MKLSRFIQTEMEQLLKSWEKSSAEIAPELQIGDSLTLREHARSILVSGILEPLHRSTSEAREESARKALGNVPALGIGGGEETGRVNQGLSTLQMILELRALRARVTKGWGDEQRGLTTTDLGELVRFNEAIDQLIANSVSSYSARKEQDTRLFDTLMKTAFDASAIYDPNGRHLFLNTAMADLLNAPVEDVIGKTALELGLDLGTEWQDLIAATVTTGQTHHREFHYRLATGREWYLNCRFVPVFNDRHEVEAVVNTARDITDRKQAAIEIWQNANFDSLTGLPNRRLFLDRLQQSRLEAEQAISSVALLSLDLDHFKHANDQLGHTIGDQLLKLVTDRLKANVRAMDTVARLGGDEFALILKNTGREGAREAARSLLTCLEKPFEVESHRVNLSGRIGVTVFPEDGKTVDQLMHNVERAISIAKEQGGRQVQLYEPGMAQHESKHLRLNKELHDAFSKHQLEVYYQPIFEIRTGAIYRAEALLRWNHPNRGLLCPAAFLTLADQCGMTDNINAFVLEQAVACSRRWRNQKGEAFPININESPASFSRTLVDQWRARLTQCDLDESRITMELTPDSLNKIRASGFNPFDKDSLERLRLHLAIDGFGIEPFSLLALQEFHVDSIKVARELIKDTGQGRYVDFILVAIIAMAHAIDVRVVAEGVEKDEQLQFLSRAGCDYAQGYLFSKPLHQGDFETLLRRDTHQKPF